MIEYVSVKSSVKEEKSEFTEELEDRGTLATERPRGDRY